jgi:murein DD-endopeptidase MepM/ murein hydrolase activator NlpD
LADPATIALAVKVALAVATDKRTWTVIGTIITAIAIPFFLTIVVFVSMLSGAADQNNVTIDLAFSSSTVTSEVPAEYRQHIEDMQSRFLKLDASIVAISTQIDSTLVKAVFYSLYFGTENLKMDISDFRKFADCFVCYEQKTDEITGETHTVAVPLADLDTIYVNLKKILNRAITQEERQNASEIYNHVIAPQNNVRSGSGSNAPTDGGSFISPIGTNWSSLVTSGYGYRTNPIGGGSEFHTGLDLGVPIGTLVHAATAGTVKYVRYDPNGFGNYVVIDRGDGLTTLYGHCSQIVVTAGATMKQGDLIAYSGSSGRSTGPHLHFEVDVGDTSQNPKKYLP